MAISRAVTPPEESDHIGDLETMRQASRAAVHQYFAIKARFAATDLRARPTGIEYDRLQQRLVELPNEYAASLPTHILSRCPFCDIAVKGPFDPWGFDGFWWSPTMRSETWSPAGCDHFRVLLGAVHLQGQPPGGGDFEAQLGPDSPYVIPRLLEFPTMTTVIHSLMMEPGYRAFPIAYFSTDVPPPGSLTQGWIEKSYCYTDSSGRPAWTVMDDPWDFELAPWITRKLALWTIPDNSDALIAPQSNELFPYSVSEATRRPQFVKNSRFRLGALPSGASPDPFD